MAKQRYINTKFWDDYYISNLDPSEKLVFLYCLTNAATTICGAYEIPIKKIALDTGFSIETVTNILQKFKEVDKILYIDGYIVIRNFIRHQSKSPKIKRGIEIEIDKLPENIKEYCIYPESYGIDTVSHSNTNTNSNFNTNTNDKQELETDITNDDINYKAFKEYLREIYMNKRLNLVITTHTNKQLLELYNLLGYEEIKKRIDIFINDINNSKHNYDISKFYFNINNYAKESSGKIQNLPDYMRN